MDNFGSWYTMKVDMPLNKANKQYKTLHFGKRYMLGETDFFTLGTWIGKTGADFALQLTIIIIIIIIIIISCWSDKKSTLRLTLINSKELDQTNTWVNDCFWIIIK